MSDDKNTTGTKPPQVRKPRMWFGKPWRGFKVILEKLRTDPAYGSLISAYMKARLDAEAGHLADARIEELAEIGTHPRDKQLKLARAWLVRHRYLKADGTPGREFARAERRRERRAAASKIDSEIVTLYLRLPQLGRYIVAAMLAAMSDKNSGRLTPQVGAQLWRLVKKAGARQGWDGLAAWLKAHRYLKADGTLGRAYHTSTKAMLKRKAGAK